MVFLFHVVHLANLSVPQPFVFIARDFGYGVFLFFIISAFSLMHSTEHTMQRPTWAKEYFVKRFWRIAPLYYAVLALMISWSVINAHYLSVEFKTLLMNLTFTFGLAPWEGIVWAGWTIGVEMLFYAIFPVLILIIRSHKAALMLLILSLVASYALRASLQTHYDYTSAEYAYNWSYFSFASNVYFFAMGIYIFRLSQKLNMQTNHRGRWWVVGVTLVVLGLLMFSELDKPLKGPGRPDLIFWGIGFSLLCMWQAGNPSRWVVNKFFEYAGERSYSIYLMHPIVIMLFRDQISATYNALTPIMGLYAYFVCAAILLIPLFVCAEMTYRLIEVPGIRWGKRISNQIRLGEQSPEMPIEVRKGLSKNV